VNGTVDVVHVVFAILWDFCETAIRLANCTLAHLSEISVAGSRLRTGTSVVVGDCSLMHCLQPGSVYVLNSVLAHGCEDHGMSLQLMHISHDLSGCSAVRV
jgi:hypothetical protein